MQRRSPNNRRTSVMAFASSALSNLENSLKDYTSSSSSHSSDHSSSRSSSFGSMDSQRMDSIIEEADALATTEDDLTDILDEDNFRSLQRALRNRGCVTNTYLQLNVHKYVQHVRSKKYQQTLEGRRADFQQEQNLRRCGST